MSNALFLRASLRGRLYTGYNARIKGKISQLTDSGKARVLFSPSHGYSTHPHPTRLEGQTRPKRPGHCESFLSPCKASIGVASPLSTPTLVQRRSFSAASAAASRARAKRSKKRRKKGAAASQSTPNLSELTGPTGRPVMTEELCAEEDILEELGLDPSFSANINASGALHNAQHKMGFQLALNHECISPNEPVPMFLATMTSTFHNPDGLEAYSLAKKNPHIQWNEAGTVELVCMGVARSKKRAGLLAAADTLSLMKEIGIDAVANPPALMRRKDDRERKKKQASKKAAEARSEEVFKKELATAQMILELLNTSKPTFELEKERVKRGNDAWVATASLLLRGRAVTVIGAPGGNKARAEGHALIEMYQSPELEQIVGEDIMAFYLDLIDTSPGGHVASLHIPALPTEWLEELNQTVGVRTDHEMRARMHALAKEEYEFFLKEREERAADRQQQTAHRNENPQRQKDIISDMLKKEEQRRQNKILEKPDGQAAKMNAIRDALPICRIKEELTEALKSDQVIVVSGGTGSGKSTQCPQYILEDALMKGKGADTQIIVTQPRKIAAVSVAERVASERTEGIGHSIGYSVRFNRRAPRDNGGSVEFVTTGVLLRRLINDPTLNSCSHVMIDEVHERDIQTDFLLVLLRDLLKARPDLRVILMSATLDADSFGEYFSDLQTGTGAVRVLKVPTQPRHPVETLYLEDLLSSTSGQGGMKSLANQLLQHNDAQLRTDLEEALEEEEAGRRLAALSRAEDEGDDLDSSDSDSGSDADEETTGRASEQTKARIDTLKRAIALRNVEEQIRVPMRNKTGDKFDSRDAVVDLTCQVAQHLALEETSAGRSGSILCFLPGWDEIKAATEQLEESSGPRLRQAMSILPLHSTIPHDDQKKVFEPANGKIKVILSTTIAESSVTIDDVLAVVDSGLVREMNFDAQANMTAMETNKTSQASATQRLGRAGRVAPGKCYRLYSRGDFEAMPARPTPEIQRTALEATCLQTCSMTTKGTVEEFLAQALDPPPKDSVALAMDRLKKLGAIETKGDGQSLTPLGRCLSHLPLDPATGRMLIMGVVMKCLDPLLTSAACFSSKSPFYNPPGFRDKALQIRRGFSDKSDIMAAVEAYDTFWDMVERESWQEAKDWAFENYVSISGMVAIRAVRSQLLDELRKIGMIPAADMQGRSRSAMLLENASVNENAGNAQLFGAIWAVAFPGNLARRRKQGSFGTLRTRMDSHAGLHPSSVGFHRKPPQDKEVRRNLPSWYLYKEMVLSSQLFLRSASALDPEQILLFGGHHYESASEYEQSPNPSNVRGILDEWIAVEGPCAETVDSLAMARAGVNAALEYKVMFPKSDLPEGTQSIVDCVADFLNLDDGSDTDGDEMEFSVIKERPSFFDTFQTRKSRSREGDGDRVVFSNAPREPTSGKSIAQLLETFKRASEERNER